MFVMTKKSNIIVKSYNMLTPTTNMTKISYKIYYTHDYNVVFNDVVLIKFKKSMF